MLNTDVQFHNLTLVRRCGSGAYGEVWLCRDITGKILALKLIQKTKQNAELKSVVALRLTLPEHPNVLSIHHVAMDEDFLWYTMDAADNLSTEDSYIPDTLENRIRQHRQLDITVIMRELIAGLAALHAVGMVHRDIKPANILFIHGRAVLGDVGMVTADTSSMSLAGTLGFIPPEIRDGTSSPGTVGKAGDVYALGMVLYCMITGNAPEEFPALPTNLPHTPQIRRLNHLACRACERSASTRLTSLDAFSRELDSIIAREQTPITLRERLVAHKRTTAKLLLWMAAAIVLIVSGVIFGPRFRGTTSAPAVSATVEQPSVPSTPVPAATVTTTLPEAEYEVVFVPDFAQVPETEEEPSLLPPPKPVIVKKGEKPRLEKIERHYETWQLPTVTKNTNPLTARILSLRKLASELTCTPEERKRLEKREQLDAFEKFDSVASFYYMAFAMNDLLRKKEEMIGDSGIRFEPQPSLRKVESAALKRLKADLLVFDDSDKLFQDYILIAKLPPMPKRTEEEWKKFLLSPEGYALYPHSWLQVNICNREIECRICENANVMQWDFFLEREQETYWLSFVAKQERFFGERAETFKKLVVAL